MRPDPYGPVSWHGLSLCDILVTERSLEGTLGGGAGLIDLQTVNGNVSVTGI